MVTYTEPMNVGATAHPDINVFKVCLYEEDITERTRMVRKRCYNVFTPQRKLTFKLFISYLYRWEYLHG